MLRTIAFIGEGHTSPLACQDALTKLNAFYRNQSMRSEQVVGVNGSMTAYTFTDEHDDWHMRYIVTLTVQGNDQFISNLQDFY